MEELASLFMHSRTQAHVFHLRVKGPGSHAAHKALQAYYKGIIPLLDLIIENYQGMSVKDMRDFKGLTKEFVIENQKVYLTTSQRGAVHKNELKTKITTLTNQKEEIKNSIDFLIYGF